MIKSVSSALPLVSCQALFPSSYLAMDLHCSLLLLLPIISFHLFLLSFVGEEQRMIREIEEDQ